MNWYKKTSIIAILITSIITGYNRCGGDQSGLSDKYSDGTYTISGWVTTEDGTALPGVVLSLGDKISETTDYYGFFKFTSITLKNGTYILTPAKSAHCFKPAYYSYALQFPGGTKNHVLQNFIGKQACSSISGTITHQDGSPLEGIPVELIGMSSRIATTDNFGRYSFTGLYNGTYTITHPHLGSTPSERIVSVDIADIMGQDFVIAGCSIAGKVTHIDGAPLAVYMLNLSGTDSTSIETDTKGNYIFYGIQVNGLYTITPSTTCTDYIFDKNFQTVLFQNMDIHGQDFTVVDLVPLDITGKITNAGVPLPGVSVHLSGINPISTITDALGVYHFSGIHNDPVNRLTPVLPGHTFFPHKRDIVRCSIKNTNLDFRVIKSWSKDLEGGLIQAMDLIPGEGYISVGQKTRLAKMSTDYFIQKFRSNDTIAWQKTFNCEAYLTDVHSLTDGGFIVAGTVALPGASMLDCWIIKLDSAGNVLWQKTYGGSENDTAYSIEQTSDGGFIVAGYSSSFGIGMYGGWIIKLNSEGMILWQNNIGNWLPSSVHQTSDGGFIFLGTTSDGPGSSNIRVVKLNTAGDGIWTNLIGYKSSFISDQYGNKILKEKRAFASSVEETPDDGYIISGSTMKVFGLLSGEEYVLLLKLNSNGSISWQKEYNFGKRITTKKIKKTLDGDYIVAGYIPTWRSWYQSVNKDIWIMKVNSNGNIIWDKIYDTDSDDLLTSIVETTNGDLIAAGSIIFKTSSDGTIDSCPIKITTPAWGEDSNAESTLTLGGSGRNNITAIVNDTKIVLQNTDAKINWVCPGEE